MVLTIVLASTLGCASLSAPPAAQSTACALGTASDGSTVTIRGEVRTTPHDLFVRPEGCPDSRIVLVYGDDKSLGAVAPGMKRDEAFLQFDRLLKEELPPRPNVTCWLCLKYRVVATFEGRLDVAPSAGWKRDARTGKVIGIEGFGHPVPFTRYRLVLLRVGNVQATERAVTRSPERP